MSCVVGPGGSWGLLLWVDEQLRLLPAPLFLPQILYSDLISLIDSSRVRSARLESGTSRLYFDLKPEAAAAAAASTSAASGKAAAAAAAAASTATATAASASEASTSGSGVELAADKAKAKRRYYVKASLARALWSGRRPAGRACAPGLWGRLSPAWAAAQRETTQGCCPMLQTRRTWHHPPTARASAAPRPTPRR